MVRSPALTSVLAKSVAPVKSSAMQPSSRFTEQPFQVVFGVGGARGQRSTPARRSRICRPAPTSKDRTLPGAPSSRPGLVGPRDRVDQSPARELVEHRESAGSSRAGRVRAGRRLLEGLFGQIAHESLSLVIIVHMVCAEKSLQEVAPVRGQALAYAAGNLSHAMASRAALLEQLSAVGRSGRRHHGRQGKTEDGDGDQAAVRAQARAGFAWFESHGSGDLDD